MTFFTRKRKLAVVAALASTIAVGCVGRKQYQINEAILISERRQLEDDIYRLQFELRDALEENEQLRAELGGKDNGTKPSKNVELASGRGAAGNASANGTALLYPGGDALQTLRVNPAAVRSQPTANAGGYQNSNVAPSTGGEIETLPDYVPIPLSSKTPKSSRPDSQSFGVRRDVAVAVAGRPAANSTAPVAASNYVEKTSASSGRVEQTNYQKSTDQNAPSGVDPWSPLAR